MGDSVPLVMTTVWNLLKMGFMASDASRHDSCGGKGQKGACTEQWLAMATPQWTAGQAQRLAGGCTADLDDGVGDVWRARVERLDDDGKALGVRAHQRGKVRQQLQHHDA